MRGGQLYRIPRASTLTPEIGGPEWTDIARVLSDEPPGVAGTGAVLTAGQALGLDLDQAVSLVHSQGGSSVSPGALSAATAKYLGALDALGGGEPPIGAYTGRIPIPSTVVVGTALLNGDPNRAYILLQNNNATGGANLLVNVDGPVDTSSPAFYLNLAPQQGILLNQNAISNPIYVAWGTGAIAGGVLMYGVRATKPAVGGGGAFTVIRQ